MGKLYTALKTIHLVGIYFKNPSNFYKITYIAFIFIFIGAMFFILAGLKNEFKGISNCKIELKNKGNVKDVEYVKILYKKHKLEKELIYSIFLFILLLVFFLLVAIDTFKFVFK